MGEELCIRGEATYYPLICNISQNIVFDKHFLQKSQICVEISLKEDVDVTEKKYSVDIHVRVYNDYAEIEVALQNEKGGYVKGAYHHLSKPNWFECTFLKRTFEEKIKKELAKRVSEAEKIVRDDIARRELQEKIKDIANGLLYRTK